MNTVAPAMAKYSFEHPDEDVFQAFYLVYQTELNRLNNPEQSEP
jgi:16S rRNA C1402 N4-methylase RsmH